MSRKVQVRACCTTCRSSCFIGSPHHTTPGAGSWGAVAGSLRYFADRFGVPRASIEGTQLSIDEVAHGAGTIGYELMCAVAPRVGFAVG